MTTAILAVHVIVALFLIFIVLIQSGKGAELGAAFGGSSQTLFGSRGAVTFFSKLTTIAAILFMITSLTLAVLSSKKESSVMKNSVVKEKTETQAPAQAPTQPLPSQPAQPSK